MTTTTATGPVLPQVASYECGSCGEIHHAPSGLPFGLPIGWSAHAATAWCGSCTAAGIPARQLREQSKSGRRAA